MEAIVFLETSKSGSSREAIKAAEKMGYKTILFTQRPKLLKQRREFPDVHELMYVNEMSEELIRKQLHALPKGVAVKGIFSFTDPYVSLASMLSNELCDTSLSCDKMKIMENKMLTREYLKELPVTPGFAVCKSEEPIPSFISGMTNLSFPLIVKSPISKASRDVYLVQTERELSKRVKQLRRANPNQAILVEEYVDGPQFLVEVIIQDGKPIIAATIEQNITKKEKFIVTGYLLKAHPEAIYESLHETVQSIIRTLGVVTGACHVEMRYAGDGWKLIEVNPRISGGAMNRMVEEAYGFNLSAETLKLFLGKVPSVERRWAKHIYTHYLTIGSQGLLLKVTGKKDASLKDGVKEVFIKPRKGTLLTSPKSMGHRYGYVIAEGRTALEAKHNAQRAAKEIKFYLEPI